jgi:hypothetical protein
MAFPQAQHPIPTCRHVSVLADVQFHSAPLPRVWHGESIWVPVPVVTIELDDKSCAWNECVDTEFPANKVLLFVSNRGSVEQRVNGTLQIVRPEFGLSDVHSDKHRSPRWIGIPTLGGAVCWPRLRLARRGPAEPDVARLTDIRVLVSSLPNVSTSLCAKTRNISTPRGNVKFHRTRLAGYLRSTHAKGGAAFARTCHLFAQAESWLPYLSAHWALLLGKPASDTFAFPTAELRSCVWTPEDFRALLANLFHGRNIRQITTTIKAIALISWLINRRLGRASGADTPLFAEVTHA